MTNLAILDLAFLETRSASILMQMIHSLDVECDEARMRRAASIILASCAPGSEDGHCLFALCDDPKRLFLLFEVRSKISAITEVKSFMSRALIDPEFGGATPLNLAVFGREEQVEKLIEWLSEQRKKMVK